MPRDRRVAARRPAARRSGCLIAPAAVTRIAFVERAYRNSTRLMAALVALLGVAMVVTTLARGGGPLALGVVLGTLFAVLGAGRLYLAGGLGSPRGRS